MSNVDPPSEEQPPQSADRPTGKNLPVESQSKPPIDPYNDPAYKHLPELRVSDLHFRPQRRTLLPIVLFLATCASTFWVGCTNWDPMEPRYVHSYGAMWRVMTTNWQVGLKYMVAVLAILLTHEMGHFLQTVRHRISASYPLCIPIPFNAIGTMGAVIGMDGMRADRRQIFDIGIAGPLAGLVVAIPVFWYGIKELDLTLLPRREEIQLYNAVGWPVDVGKSTSAMGRSRMDRAFATQSVLYGRLGRDVDHRIEHVANQPARWRPYYLRLVPGPSSRLCTLVRDHRHPLYSATHQRRCDVVAYAHLVILMGIHHPPTANDHVDLGPVRWIIGVASLSIPLLCFPLLGFRQ